MPTVLALEFRYNLISRKRTPQINRRCFACTGNCLCICTAAFRTGVDSGGIAAVWAGCCTGGELSVADGASGERGVFIMNNNFITPNV